MAGNGVRLWNEVIPEAAKLRTLQVGRSIPATKTTLRSKPTHRFLSHIFSDADGPGVWQSQLTRTRRWRSMQKDQRGVHGFHFSFERTCSIPKLPKGLDPRLHAFVHFDFGLLSMSVNFRLYSKRYPKNSTFSASNTTSSRPPGLPVLAARPRHPQRRKDAYRRALNVSSADARQRFLSAQRPLKMMADRKPTPPAGPWWIWNYLDFKDTGDGRRWVGR